MKKIKSPVLFVLLLFFAHTLLSQNNKIDSLKIELQNHIENDTLKVNLLNELIGEIYFSDLFKADTLIKESKLLSEKLDYTFGKAKSIYYQGRVTSRRYDYVGANIYFYEAIEIFEGINKKKEIANCYSGISKSFYMLGNPEKAIEYCKKELAINKGINYTAGISQALNNLGVNYMVMGKYNEAINYFKEALEYRTKDNNLRGMASTSNNIGVIYEKQGNAPKALEFFHKSLDIFNKIYDNEQIINTLNNIGAIYQNQNNYNKALIYYNKGLDASIARKHNTGTAKSLSHIGSVYADLSQHEKALSFIYKALKINEEINNKSSISTNFTNIANSQLALNKNKEAIETGNKALNVANEIKRELNILNARLVLAKAYEQDKKYDKALFYALKSKKTANKLESPIKLRDANEILFKIYKNIGNYKDALESHQQFKVLNDSLFNKENIEKIAHLEYEYKYKQALDSASIRELKLTKTVQSTSNDLEISQRNYLWAIIGVLLVSILLGSIIFYQKLRHVKSKTENIVMEQKLLRSQMTPHFIFNSLSVLQGMILNKEDKKAVYYLSKFSKLLRITLENSRDKMVSLSQELMAIQDYLTLQNLENEAYNYTVLVDQSINVPDFDVPPMLIQPFVENAIEHAFVDQKENRKIDIKLSYSDFKLICTISDNGVGINTEKDKKRKDKKSLATTITSERLKILSKDLKMDGSVMVENRKLYGDYGTIVTLEIPHKMA